MEGAGSDDASLATDGCSGGGEQGVSYLAILEEDLWPWTPSRGGRRVDVVVGYDPRAAFPLPAWSGQLQVVGKQHFFLRRHQQMTWSIKQ